LSFLARSYRQLSKQQNGTSQRDESLKVDFILLEASRESTEVLQFGEASFNTIPLFVKSVIVLSFGFAVGSGRNDWFCATGLDVLHNRFSIITFVGEYIIRRPIA
jgi:hypothetical protein